MELYLIRHGESEANSTDTHSGWSPVNLTPLGEAQAAQTGALLSGTTFDRIFVSDIKRAQQTAHIIFPGRHYTYIPLAREMNNTTMQGKTYADMLALFPDLYPVCRKRFDYSPLGLDCESGAHMLARAGEFLRFMQGIDANRIACVCHAGFIRTCAAYVLGASTHNPPLTCRNASVSVLSYAKDKWRIKLWDATGDWP